MPDAVDIIRNIKKSSPVDIERIIREIGLRLDIITLSNDISGAIVQEFKGVYKILVNSKGSEFRHRFTMAHELGHYLLHRPMIGDGVDDDMMFKKTTPGYSNRFIEDKEEMEANNFAASLLMPGELIEQIKKDGIITPEDLAEKFKVSVGAMKIRLEDF